MEFLKLNSGSSTFLNLARVIAAQFVVIGHLLSWLKIFPKLQPPFLPYMQGIGVVVFFILSGFLIPYSTVLKLKQNPKYSFKDFFIERFSRIFVSLIPCILIVVVIDSLYINFYPTLYEFYDGFNFKTFIGNLLMLEDNPFYKTVSFMNIVPFGSARPFWTLAIEWWIYFWFAYLFLEIFIKKKTNLLSVLILAFFSIIPLSNFIFGIGGGLFLPWCCGALLFILWPFFNRLNQHKLLSITSAIALLFLMFIHYRKTFFIYVEPYYVMYLSLFIMILLVLSNSIDIKEKTKKVIQFFADYSFTLYLLHYSLLNFFLVIFKPETNKLTFLILSFLVVNLFSIVVAKYTEMKYKVVRSFLIKKFASNE